MGVPGANVLAAFVVLGGKAPKQTELPDCYFGILFCKTLTRQLQDEITELLLSLCYLQYSIYSSCLCKSSLRTSQLFAMAVGVGRRRCTTPLTTFITRLLQLHNLSALSSQWNKEHGFLLLLNPFLLDLRGSFLASHFRPRPRKTPM